MLLAVLYARYLWERIWDAASGENCDVILPLSCCSCCLVAITNVVEPTKSVHTIWTDWTNLFMAARLQRGP